MNKEEILAKSKQENRGMDIVNLEVSKNSTQFGWTFSYMMMAIVTVVNAIVKSKNSFEVCFVMLAGSAALFGHKYAKLHKKHELIVSILFGLGALACLVGWIIQLTK